VARVLIFISDLDTLEEYRAAAGQPGG